MTYSIFQNMEDIYKNPDTWVNHGRYALENNCNHHEKGEEETNMRYKGYCEECETSEDSAIPIINYLYPLELKDFDEDKILKVVSETNCTVLENQDTGEWFLALCGGGMDLSQDIAFAYLILERWIPFDLLIQVISQKGFSISKANYKELKKAILEQAEIYKSLMSEVINKGS